MDASVSDRYSERTTYHLNVEHWAHWREVSLWRRYMCCSFVEIIGHAASKLAMDSTCLWWTHRIPELMVADAEKDYRSCRFHIRSVGRNSICDCCHSLMLRMSDFHCNRSACSRDVRDDCVVHWIDHWCCCCDWCRDHSSTRTPSPPEWEKWCCRTLHSVDLQDRDLRIIY